MDKIAWIEQDLLNLYDGLLMYYTSDYYFDNYSAIPVETGFKDAAIYDDAGRSLKQWVINYRYRNRQELFQDLYIHCAVQSVWNPGYEYAPKEVISFGYYWIGVIDVTIPDSLIHRIKTLSVQERNCIISGFLIDYETMAAHMHVYGGVSFELSIADAVEYTNIHR